eukprot:jgi/Bigna1/128669/aug1.7_g3377
MTGQNDNTCINAIVRIRPILKFEKSRGARSIVKSCEKTVSIETKSFTYDGVFDESSTQDAIYDRVSPVVESFLTGYNGTIIAYGQTGSGKTYTMGTSDCSGGSGVVPQACSHVFQTMYEKEKDNKICELQATFVEIYNEQTRDLLNKARPIEHMKFAHKRTVKSVSEVMNCLAEGSQSRATGSTRMNKESSRSHAIFTLWLTQIPKQKASQGEGEAEEADEILASKFHFVDLAGSERLKRTGAEGARVKEGIQINKGLFALSQVITALSQKKPHVPFRDSKITRLLEVIYDDDDDDDDNDDEDGIDDAGSMKLDADGDATIILKDSLGGNARTVLVACISPADDNRVRRIENKPTLNFSINDAKIKRYRLRIQELEEQVKALKEYKRNKQKEDLRRDSSSSSTSSASSSSTTRLSGGGGSRGGKKGNRKRSITESNANAAALAKAEKAAKSWEAKFHDLKEAADEHAESLQEEKSLRESSEREMARMRLDIESLRKRFREKEQAHLRTIHFLKKGGGGDGYSCSSISTTPSSSSKVGPSSFSSLSLSPSPLRRPFQALSSTAPPPKHQRGRTAASAKKKKMKKKQTKAKNTIVTNNSRHPIRGGSTDSSTSHLSLSSVDDEDDFKNSLTRQSGSTIVGEYLDVSSSGNVWYEHLNEGAEEEGGEGNINIDDDDDDDDDEIRSEFSELTSNEDEAGNNNNNNNNNNNSTRHHHHHHHRQRFYFDENGKPYVSPRPTAAAGLRKGDENEEPSINGVGSKNDNNGSKKASFGKHLLRKKKGTAALKPPLCSPPPSSQQQQHHQQQHLQQYAGYVGGGGGGGGGGGYSSFDGTQLFGERARDLIKSPTKSNHSYAQARQIYKSFR